MKNILYCPLLAVALALPAQTVIADVLLTDTFQVSSNSQNVNQELATRQTGPLAPAAYTGWHVHHQVGNTTTDVGQPGGAANGNFVLLAFDGSFFSDVDLGTVAAGPVTVEFDMYLRGANPGGASDDTWVACSLRSPGDMFPVCGADEFAFLVRANGGVQAFQSGGSIAPGNWDTAGFALADHWKLIFSDAAGTGSAFNGNGSQVTLINGTTTLGTLSLGQLRSVGLRLGFRNAGSRFGGISNFSISGTPSALPPPGHNLSFEYDQALSGTSLNQVPTSWTAFNAGGPDYIGSQHAAGVDYTVQNPLAAPADGNQFCWINMFNGNGVGGIYQDMGPLQTNSIYTLTVAIGSRADRINSPGLISLVQGTDNTGTVLATGGGLPATQDTWQDYTVTFTTGPAVSGDLTIVLAALGAGTIQADFDNVRLSVEQLSVPPPFLIQQTTPASAKIGYGSNAVFTAAFSNNPPVTLQWQQVVSGSPGLTNDINLGVVTTTNNEVVTSTLTINNAQLSATGLYRLRAVNAAGVAVYTTPSSLSVIPTITWYAAGAYNGSFSDSSVLALAGTAANEVYGVDFGGAGFQTTTNNYTFDDYGNGNLSIAGSGLNAFGGYLNGNTLTGDSGFDLILADGINGSAANTGTLNNLTVGQAYTVMVLLADTRSTGAGGSTFHVTDGLTVSPEQQYAFANGVPKIGGFIMGTFTARATTQPLTVLNNNNSSQYNAILLVKGIAPPPAIPPTLITDIQSVPGTVAAGVPLTFSVVVSGAPPLTYQWYNQSGPITGATNSGYVFGPVDGTSSYHVVITNSFGSVTSSVASVTGSAALTLNNFSFEADAPNQSNGTIFNGNITGWSDFNKPVWDYTGTQIGSGVDYATINPLAAPADGPTFLWINRFNGNGVGGVYQDVGALQPNTAYTLTVAIGSRKDRINSPGIISLVQGTNNTGTVLATGGGLPDTQDTWQDYTVTFTSGASVSGDITIVLSVLGSEPSIQADFDNVRLTKTAAPTAIVVGSPRVSGGNLILTGSGGTPNSGYTVLTTTNLTTPLMDWTVSTTGTTDGAGAFSNGVPVSVTQPGSFYRVRVP